MNSNDGKVINCEQCEGVIDRSRYYYYYIFKGINYLCQKCHDDIYSECNRCRKYWKINRLEDGICPICTVISRYRICSICSNYTVFSTRVCSECIENIISTHSKDPDIEGSICYICEKMNDCRITSVLEVMDEQVVICDDCYNEYKYKQMPPGPTM